MSRVSLRPGALLVLGTALSACAMNRTPEDSPSPSMSSSAPNTLSEAERREGWVSLFDGTNLSAWRGYKAEGMPAGWQIVDGSLTRVARGGDIITREKYGNFDLTYEWKVEPGGNSGIMFLVTEDNERTYESGPEMQVLDDERHADGKNPLTSAGALYAMYPAPRGVVRPAGEWNTARIRLKDGHVQYWLNGTKTADAQIGGADWNAKVAASKFKEWPTYAKAKEGHIAIQDHGDRVMFRSIKIRKL
jgi:hypothetical protein